MAKMMPTGGGNGMLLILLAAGGLYMLTRPRAPLTSVTNRVANPQTGRYENPQTVAERLARVVGAITQGRAFDPPKVDSWAYQANDALQTMEEQGVNLFSASWGDKPLRDMAYDPTSASIDRTGMVDGTPYAPVYDPSTSIGSYW